MISTHTNTIPSGWATTRLGDVLHAIRGITFPKDAKSKEPREGDIACLRTTNVQYAVEWHDLWFLSPEFVKREEQWVRPGDILLSNANSRELVGKVALVKDMPRKATLGAFISALRTREPWSAAYLYYQLASADRQQAIRALASTTTNISNVSTKKISEVELRIAPPMEQVRIVDAIEEQFTRLDSGVAALKRVEVNLKRYKASVLKAACEGKLTEKWRQEHPDVEPASELLKRILKERRSKWEEAELAKMIAKGKPPKDDNWKEKYKEPEGPDSSQLPELPPAWTWATVRQVSSRIQYGSSAKASQEPDGIPVLRMGNLTSDGRILRDRLKYLPGDHAEFPELLLDSGDLLFNRTNSPELVGKSAVYMGFPDPCSFASYLIRVKTIRGSLPHHLAYCLNSDFGRAWIQSVVTQQVGQANVNGTKLASFAFPFPPQQEQEAIQTTVEESLSLIEYQAKALSVAFRKTGKLRQSILKRAFEGKLVEQDSSDEPASVLLDRIRASRDDHDSGKSQNVRPGRKRRKNSRKSA